MGDEISEKSLRGTTTSVIGTEIEIFPKVVSTNDVARERAEGGCREGLMIISRSQGSGRGRSGRSFASPEGGLYLSVVLKPDIPPKDVSIIPLLAGLAVSKSISSTLMVPTSLKWPNDVMVDGRKVCGILVESSVKGDRLDYLIVGIGINVNFSISDLPGELEDTAVTLKDHTGNDIDTEELLRNLVCFLEMLYNRFRLGETASILDDWSEGSETLGRNVRVKTTTGVLEGKALGLDQTGALLLSSDGTLQRIDLGDVENLR